MTYASQLKMMRQARGLTQEQLAEKSGIPNTYLSLMETGKVIPSGEWETRLRDALGWTPEADVSLAQLAGRTPEPAEVEPEMLTAGKNVLPEEQPA
jgi:transcriptional regulator with XRE-family HTH domain